MESRLKGAAVQNSALMAARRQDAVSMQQFRENESQLRATVAEQAAAIQQHKALATHTGRHLKILTRLVSKLRSQRQLKARELEEATVHSHVEALREEKTGLQKTLEETEARLTKEERSREYAWSEAQHRGRKRQEMQAQACWFDVYCQEQPVLRWARTAGFVLLVLSLVFVCVVL